MAIETTLTEDEKTMRDLLYQLESEFRNVNVAFVKVLIPFSIKAIGKDGKIIKPTEEELKEITKDYDNLKARIENLKNTVISFVTKLIKGPRYIRDEKFIISINEWVDSTLSMYDRLWRSIQEENEALFRKIEKAYIAFLMLVRLLNTVIHYYNQNYPDHPISEIKGLPDPQYLDIGKSIKDITAFLVNFVEDIKKYLD